MLTTPAILLVDQHADTREMYALFFRMRGWHLVSVGHAEAALLLLQHFNPLTIITEVALPDMDGGEFCRRVRTEAGRENIPVIAFTGVPEARFDCSCFAKVLGKPLGPEELLAAVDEVVGGHPPLLYDAVQSAVRRARASRDVAAHLREAASTARGRRRDSVSDGVGKESDAK